MRNDLPLFKPPQLRGKYLSRVLKSRWLTAGPVCERLREALGEHFEWDAKKIVLANSATAGWQAVLDSFESSKREEAHVSIRDDTFAGMFNCVKNSQPKTPIRVSTDIGGREGGAPFWPTNYFKVADVCHTALLRREAAVNILSMYPTKPIPGSEGGALFVLDEGFAQYLRQLVDCGFAGWPRDYSAAVWGRKANMTDVQAALALEALELSDGYMEGLREAWFRMRKVWRQGWAGLWGIEDPVNVYRRPYLFQVELPTGSGLTVAEVQKRLPFATGWHFPPNRRLTLPMWPGIPVSAIKRMCKALSDVDFGEK